MRGSQTERLTRFNAVLRGVVSMTVLLSAPWFVVPGQATHVKNTKIVSLVFEEILLEG